MAQIPIDELQGLIWLNGKIVDWQNAKVHILTHGLHYGSSVFEGIRVYQGNAFKLNEHLSRLYHSAECLRFNIPYNIDELTFATNEQIQLNNITNGYIRPFAWRGTETLLISGGGKTANVAIAVWPIFEDSRSDIRERGIRMNISSWRKPAPNASPYTAKAASIYTLSTIVKNDAQSAGYDDSIMLDAASNVTEGTTSNIFFLKNNELHTPVADCFLNGITRQTIIKIATDKGYKTYERKIHIDEIASFDAAFLTGTAIEIMPIDCIEQHMFNTKHPITAVLTQAYLKLTKA